MLHSVDPVIADKQHTTVQPIKVESISVCDKVKVEKASPRSSRVCLADNDTLCGRSAHTAASSSLDVTMDRSGRRGPSLDTATATLQPKLEQASPCKRSLSSDSRSCVRCNRGYTFSAAHQACVAESSDAHQHSVVLMATSP